MSSKIIAKEDLNSSYIVWGPGKKPKGVGNPKLHQLSYYFEVSSPFFYFAAATAILLFGMHYIYHPYNI